MAHRNDAHVVLYLFSLREPMVYSILHWAALLHVRIDRIVLLDLVDELFNLTSILCIVERVNGECLKSRCRIVLA